MSQISGIDKNQQPKKKITRRKRDGETEGTKLNKKKKIEKVIAKSEISLKKMLDMILVKIKDMGFEKKSKFILDEIEKYNKITLKENGATRSIIKKFKLNVNKQAKNPKILINNIRKVITRNDEDISVEKKMELFKDEDKEVQEANLKFFKDFNLIEIELRELLKTKKETKIGTVIKDPQSFGKLVIEELFKEAVMNYINNLSLKEQSIYGWKGKKKIELKYPRDKRYFKGETSGENKFLKNPSEKNKKIIDKEDDEKQSVLGSFSDGMIRSLDFDRKINKSKKLVKWDTKFLTTNRPLTMVGDILGKEVFKSALLSNKHYFYIDIFSKDKIIKKDSWDFIEIIHWRNVNWSLGSFESNAIKLSLINSKLLPGKKFLTNAELMEIIPNIKNKTQTIKDEEILKFAGGKKESEQVLQTVVEESIKESVAAIDSEIQILKIEKERDLIKSQMFALEEKVRFLTERLDSEIDEGVRYTLNNILDKIQLMEKKEMGEILPPIQNLNIEEKQLSLFERINDNFNNIKLKQIGRDFNFKNISKLRLNFGANRKDLINDIIEFKRGDFANDDEFIDFID